MSLLSADFLSKARAGLAALGSQPALLAAVSAETDAFFAKYPELERTKLTEAWFAALVLEKLSPADSQSAEQTKNQNQKVA